MCTFYDRITTKRDRSKEGVMFGNDVQNVLWGGVLYFRGRFEAIRGPLCENVLFSQSPEI